MNIAVRLFAGLRERAGTDTLEVELPDGSTVADAAEAAAAGSPRSWRVPGSLMFAVNEEYVDRSHPLKDGDELALIPPVSGGATTAQAPYVLITEEPLDPRDVAHRVQADEDGAVLVFEGVTRNHHEGRQVRYLEYEAYRPMADRKIHELLREISEKWDIDRAAVAHRLGRVDIGETSMVVAVSAPHRRPVFEATLHFVDRLKEVVPIWKKEHFEGGSAWINDPE